MFQGLVEDQGAALLQALGLIQAADEQQIGKLFHHLHGVGDAPGPEGVPDGIDLAAQLSGKHRFLT